MGAAMVLGVGFLMDKSIQQARFEKVEIDQWKVRLANSEIKVLAGYLVANNLILCREGGWKDLSSRNRNCRWGGGSDFLLNNAIPESKFNLSAADWESDGSLVFRSSTLVEGVAMESTLRFSLTEWAKDARLREMIGFVPNDLSIADDETDFVVISVDSSMRGVRGSTVKSLGAIRRPIGQAVLRLTGNTLVS
jgi:hypothetical protein